MAVATIHPANFSITFSGRPFDEVLRHAAGDILTEGEIFCPTVNREGAGGFVQAITEEGPVGSFQFPDGAEAPYTTYREGYTKVWHFKKYGVQIGVTTMTLDNWRKRGEKELVVTLEDLTNKIKRAHRVSRERRMAGAMLAADTSGYAYEDVTVPNGQALYSTAHPFKNISLSQSNKAASYAAPSASTINTARLNLFALKDAQGAYRPYAPLVLLTSPTCSNTNNLPDIFKERANILNAAQRNTNPIYTREWGDIGLTEVRHFGTDTTWFLAKTDKDMTPLVRWVRRPLKAISTLNELAETRVTQINEWDTIAARNPYDTYGYFSE